MKDKFPASFYNPITIGGSVLSLLSFGLIIFLIVLELFGTTENPYLVIITFMILPSFLILGLLLVAFGVLKEKKRIKKGNPQRELPILDFNNPRHRLTFFIFTFGSILLLFFSAFGSFKAYEYAETDEFCGTVCHKVMEPEYTAYLNSPHNRVGCVQCHIGSGADWFVKSKITGSYQVYSVLFNKYSKPIPTPVESLRPAQGTCEQCHSPKHFFSEKKVDYSYYLSDKDNSKSKLTMLLKIGGGNIELGNARGIHWHMNIENEVTYYAVDRERQIIPWVKMKSKKTGKEIIYRSTEVKLNEKRLSPESFRVMDCIDCHNRPSHIYNQPDKMMNLFMSLGRIDDSLPYIKSVGVQALEKPYSTKEVGLDSIKIFINDFYSHNYPEIYKSKASSIKSSILEIQKIYSRNYFPSMNTNWKKFANNIGHVWDNGCFRCHDGKHVSEDGKIISKDCNACHTILSSEDENGFVQTSVTGLQFNHPIDLGSSLKDWLCTDCHGRE
ncbi:MAG: NapC/NirT family cytochrome c [Ignavibacteriales bacterium]|nr:NapC/NirT family cytochrome c [Ignavibacteriales bacterium]